MKIRRADMAYILFFIVIMTMTLALGMAFVANGVFQEKRGTVSQMVEQETLDLQAKIQGYSTVSSYCFMHRNGSRLTQTEATDLVKSEIERTKANITARFEKKLDSTGHYTIDKTAEEKALLHLDTANPIEITIIDSGAKRTPAKLRIVVSYRMSLWAPYATEDPDDTPSSYSRISLPFREIIERTIENPIREKNI